MVFLAAGLNIHKQLTQTGNNIREFTRVGYQGYTVLLATWSTIVFEGEAKLSSTGYQKLLEGSILHPRSAIGDHNGMLGCLDRDGNLYLAEGRPDQTTETIRCQGDARPQLSFIAMAGNGRVVSIFQQAESSNLMHVGEFGTFEAFKAWYADPSNPDCYPKAHHMIPGRPKQLIAGTASFAMLLSNDELYTWGDPRHQSLARSTIGDGAVPADRPGLVEALAGVRLRKICLGGWMGGAISEDGAAYLWGAGQPGKQSDRLKALSTGDQVALIQLTNDDDEPDIVDMSIGDGHVALVTAACEIFVAGENRSGQLGLDSPVDFVDVFTKVPGMNDATGVICAPKNTIVQCRGAPNDRSSMRELRSGGA